MEFRRVPAAKDGEKNEKAPNVTKAESALPRWPITENLQLTTQFKVGKLQYNDLAASGLEWTGTISKGFLRGRARIQNAFGGKSSAEKIEVNLFESEPTSHLTVTTAGTDIGRLVAWVSPKWKGLVGGQATGTATLMVPYPARSDFIENTKASGHIKIVNGSLSTLQFDKTVNEKLAAIPGVGKKKIVNSKGASGNIDSEFNFSDGQLELKTLNVLTPEKNELDGSGYVKLDQTMDLKGQVVLTNAQVMPAVLEHNSDGHGRLKLAVHFDGNVFKPETHLLDTTLKQLIANTASGEVTKFKKQVVKEGQQKLIDEGRKKLQNLFSN
jgi:hypothetical protein